MENYLSNTHVDLTTEVFTFLTISGETYSGTLGGVDGGSVYLNTKHTTFSKDSSVLSIIEIVRINDTFYKDWFKEQGIDQK